MDNFRGQEVKIIGYSNGFLKLAIDDNTFGYTIPTFIPNGKQYEKILQEKLEKEISSKKGVYFLSNEVHSINSADGVDIRIVFGYNGEKSIKYLSLKMKSYNRAGDQVSDKISGDKIFTIDLKGLINKFNHRAFTHDAFFYNSTAVCMELINVSLEFMDGTKKN